ncbi:MAG TPA: FAD:protein FMN transferase [Candidatus Saccharimonadales bacterium]|nr:FAD:protein FMN transferase [Candidatus Saccharimonadales bacterium]
MKQLQQSRHALGSTAIITLVTDDQTDADEVCTALWRIIDQFERRFSRFLPDSELSQLNHEGGVQYKISAAFHALLSTAKKFAQATNGLYNPCILPALQRAGYKGSWPQPEHAATAALAYDQRRMASWQDISIGGDWARIPQDTALDFGGIGKGYLLDELGAWLRAKGITSFWLSLGGDILCDGVDASSMPWRISIQHALRQADMVAHVTNEGQALAIATSGVTKRKGITNGAPWHHLIDPRTGEPAITDVLTATVCATSATNADVCAKCIVIAGKKEGLQLAQSLGVQDTLVQTYRAGNVHIYKKGSVWSM